MCVLYKQVKFNFDLEFYFKKKIFSRNIRVALTKLRVSFMF